MSIRIHVKFTQRQALLIRELLSSASATDLLMPAEYADERHIITGAQMALDKALFAQGGMAADEVLMRDVVEARLASLAPLDATEQPRVPGEEG